MKQIILSFIAIASLSGCLKYTPMYKVGATQQESRITQAQCHNFAAETVPVLLIHESFPIYDDQGKLIGFTHEVFDANEGRRHSVAKNCMLSEGYQRVSIPYCEDEQIAGRNYTPLTILPPLTENICAIRQRGGSRVLIDLSKPVN